MVTINNYGIQANTLNSILNTTDFEMSHNELNLDFRAIYGASALQNLGWI